MVNNSQTNSVLNTHQSRDSVLDIANNQQQNYANEQKQNEMNEYISTSQEDVFLSDVRITDVPEMNTDALDAIYIDTEAVLNKAGELSTLNQDMVDEFNNVIINMSNLETAWTASASSNAISSFSILKDHLNARSTQMNNYINLIKQVIVSGYEDTDTTNTTLADAFK